MRVVKEAAERRNEILDAADELFAQKGYDGTSTQDILAQVGIARGTLYHHFKSKSAIMDALIERYNERLLGNARLMAADKHLPVIERMINVVLSLQMKGGGSEQIMEHIHKPQNALMHQKIQRVLIQGITPIMADIVREGVEQGLFDAPYPYEAMEMAVIYASTVFDDDYVTLTAEERITRIHAFIFHLERLLGAKRGALTELMQTFAGEAGRSDA